MLLAEARRLRGPFLLPKAVAVLPLGMLARTDLASIPIFLPRDMLTRLQKHAALSFSVAGLQVHRARLEDFRCLNEAARALITLCCFRCKEVRLQFSKGGLKLGDSVCLRSALFLDPWKSQLCVSETP